MKRNPEYRHGGRPWSFWNKAGGFIYVFGQLCDDSTCPPPDASMPIKIGITKNPADRLIALQREHLTFGSWLSIQWMASSSEITEQALHELLNPWRCPFKNEFFEVPDEVEEWIFDGFKDQWSQVQKHHRLFGESALSLCLEIIPRYYPAPWLNLRVAQMKASLVA